jgi:hypothetical protein
MVDMRAALAVLVLAALAAVGLFTLNIGHRGGYNE